jgi:PAS domain-containing protein
MLRLLDQFNMGCALYSPTRGCFAADQAFADILGRSIEDLMGLSMKDVTHPDDIAANKWLLEGALRTGASFAFKKRYRLPDQSDRWVQNRYTVFGSGDETILLLQCRPVAQPAEPPKLEADVLGDLPRYVRDMTDELARLAAASGMSVTAELLTVAARMAADEIRDRVAA